jgi:hypothetical protein
MKTLTLLDPFAVACFVAGGLVVFALCLLADALRSAPDEEAAPDWRKLYGEEQARFDRLQARFDRLQALFERLRDLDDHSAAARPHELRAIEKEYQRLTALVSVSSQQSAVSWELPPLPRECQHCGRTDVVAINSPDGVQCLGCNGITLRMPTKTF